MDSAFLGLDQVELHLGWVLGWGFVWYENNLEAITFIPDFGAPFGTSKLLLQEMEKKNVFWQPGQMGVGVPSWAQWKESLNMPRGSWALPLPHSPS